MKSSSLLLELVKKLDQAEKRYIKLSLNNTSTTSKEYCIEIFDLFEKATRQVDSTPAQIVVDIKKRITPTNTSYHLVATYNKLLDALRVYHANKEPRIRIKNQLADLYVLFDKGLYANCQQHIESLLAACNKYERPMVHLELIEWMTALGQFTRSGYADKIKYYDALFNDAVVISNNNLATLKNYINKFKAYSLIQHDSHLSAKAVREDFNRFVEIQNKEEGEEKYPYQFYLTMHKMELQILAAGVGKNYKECIRLLKEQFSFYKKHKGIVQDILPNGFSTVLNNIAYYYYHIGEYSNAIKLTDKLFRFPELIFLRVTPIARADAQVSGYNIKLLSTLRLGLSNKSLEFEEEIKFFLKSSHELLEPGKKIELFYNLARILCTDNKAKHVIYWLNEVINDKNDDVRVDLKCAARIMRIITYYDLGEFEFIGNIAKQTKQFIQKKTSISKSELMLLDFLTKKLVFAKSLKSQEELYRELKYTIESMSKKETGSLQNLNILAWLESKIKNISFAQVVREQAQLT